MERPGRFPREYVGEIRRPDGSGFRRKADSSTSDSRAAGVETTQEGRIQETAKETVKEQDAPEAAAKEEPSAQTQTKSAAAEDTQSAALSLAAAAESESGDLVPSANAVTTETETETETESLVVDVTDTILTSASMNHSAWVTDGKVELAGEPFEGQDAVADWSDIAQVSVSDSHVIALDHTGMVYAAGDNSSQQCDVAGQRGILYIEAGMKCSILVTGRGKIRLSGVVSESIRSGLMKERNVSRVDLSDTHAVVLHTDGTAAAYGNSEAGALEVSEWKDLTDICAGHDYTAGLTSDGKVLIAGEDTYGLKEAQNWEGIKQITAGASHIAGLREDGTVAACGKNRLGECEVSDWTGVLSVSAGYDHTIGLSAGNIPVAAGYNGNGQCGIYGSEKETEK